MSEELTRGVMWGQLLTGIEGARQSLDLARRGETLLTMDDRDRLRSAMDTLAALEQRTWEAMNSAGKARRSKRR